MDPRGILDLMAKMGNRDLMVCLVALVPLVSLDQRDKTGVMGLQDEEENAVIRDLVVRLVMRVFLDRLELWAPPDRAELMASKDYLERRD